MVDLQHLGILLKFSVMKTYYSYYSTVKSIYTQDRLLTVNWVAKKLL